VSTLTGKVAIVTGASRGIGRSIALALAAEGADIVCAARTTDSAPAKLPGTIEETARQVEALGRRALAVACDIRSADDVRALVDKTLSAFGRIDLLVNNAAVNVRAPFLETTPERWDLVLDVNLGGSVNCIRAVLPHMVERGSGNVINVSSGAVTLPEITAQLGIIGYTVSKAAVEKLTETLAIELAPKGVSMNCLRIESAVVTEGALAVDPDGDYSGWEKPENVADAVVWLATRPAVYTGRMVTVGDVRKERDRASP
jgi:NAD(P)-dependent dehydrogenase (short-subunit alcohol dehydrogenase family)